MDEEEDEIKDEVDDEQDDVPSQSASVVSPFLSGGQGTLYQLWLKVKLYLSRKLNPIFKISRSKWQTNSQIQSFMVS